MLSGAILAGTVLAQLEGLSRVLANETRYGFESSVESPGAYGVE